MPLPQSEIILHITGMDCANCALTLEHSLARLDGIDEIRVSFPTATLEAHGTISRDTVVEHVRALGYDVASPSEGRVYETAPLREGGSRVF